VYVNIKQTTATNRRSTDTKGTLIRMAIVVICMAVGFLLWGLAATAFAPHKLTTLTWFTGDKEQDNDPHNQ
jgi:hypothetical protein